MAKTTPEKKIFLKWHRHSGLSVQEFADALGVSIQTASNSLYGRNKPGVLRAIQMAEMRKIRNEEVDCGADPKTVELPPMPEGEGVTPQHLTVAKV